MVNEILNAAGICYRRARFLKPPAQTYAVFTDDVEAIGGDYVIGAWHHQITVEVYEPAPDDQAEAAIECALSERGVQYEKQDRYWLQAEQRYQVVYEFDYYTKRRN